MSGIEYNLNSKASVFFQEEEALDPYDVFNTRASPITENSIGFTFPPSKDKYSDIFVENTGITQNSILVPMYKLEKDEKHAKTPSNNCSKKSSSTNVTSTVVDNFDLDQLVAPFRETKTNKNKVVVRRDVINKTIFRIIRRYYHSLLEKLIPDYKKQKKNNLMKMLISLSEYLFSRTEDSSEIALVLSALMFRREFLLSKIDSDTKTKVQIFLDVQSKYTHKLLEPVMGNKYFQIIFEHFLGNGMSFFGEDENVTKHSKAYQLELEKLRNLYINSSKAM